MCYVIQHDYIQRSWERVSKRSYVEQQNCTFYYILFAITCFVPAFILFFIIHTVYMLMFHKVVCVFFYIFFYLYVRTLQLYFKYTQHRNMYSHFYAHIIDCVCLYAYECGVCNTFLCAKQTFFYDSILCCSCHIFQQQKKVKSEKCTPGFIGKIYWVILLWLSMNNWTEIVCGGTYCEILK